MSDIEDDFNPRAHHTLLQAIGGLRKTNHIRKSTRSEPRIKQNEFELVKGTSVVTKAVDDNHHSNSTIAVNDLVQVLRKKKKHIDAGKLLKNVHRTKKVFQEPLQKPAAERIKRKIGYDNVKGKLERWDAVVAKNRTAETQIFPLPSETIYIDTSLHAKPLTNALKSDLRREMEATEEKLRQLKRQREGDFEDEADLEKRRNELHKIKMTRDELVARRKELAYLKMRESQQSAKARMRNKIKSKKYHKLLRKQKLQAQLKEFEQLQKTNPEAALEKLNELEKSRVKERATLRHKNTGSWAKNLQVRAKYDKDVRKDLAEQLKISHELTQKLKTSDREESDNDVGGDEAIQMEFDEEHEDNNGTVDLKNPWFTASGKMISAENGTTKKSEEKDGNWRKYWLERNMHEKVLDAYKDELETLKREKDSNEVAGKEVKLEVEPTETSQKQTKPKKETKSIKKETKSIKAQTKSIKKEPKYENGWLVEDAEIVEDAKKTKIVKGKPLRNIDDLFDEVEERIETKVQKKLTKLKKETKRLDKKEKKTKKTKTKNDALKNLKDLTFKDEAKRPIIDEELNNEEDTNNKNSQQLLPKHHQLSGNTSKQETTTTTTANETPYSNNIDPTKIPHVTLKQPHLQALNAAAEAGDEDTENFGDGVFHEHQMTISEAFEDDDIVADFGHEKTKDSELKNTEIELSMPGWGAWAGAGISEQEAQKRRQKRIVLKLAPEEKRRDQNKGELYINEEASKQLRTHLVSDVPFPFTSLQDYEASIRAPIGRNFVPETAFRMLTRPAVITRKGTIIEPMDEQELTKRPYWPRNAVDQRINATMAKTKTAAVK